VETRFRLGQKPITTEFISFGTVWRVIISSKAPRFTAKNLNKSPPKAESTDSVKAKTLPTRTSSPRHVKFISSAWSLKNHRAHRAVRNRLAIFLHDHHQRRPIKQNAISGNLRHRQQLVRSPASGASILTLRCFRSGCLAGRLGRRGCARLLWRGICASFRFHGVHR